MKGLGQSIVGFGLQMPLDIGNYALSGQLQKSYESGASEL